MDGYQIRILKQPNQVRLARFLQAQDRVTFKSQVGLKILGDFADKPTPTLVQVQHAPNKMYL